MAGCSASPFCWSVLLAVRSGSMASPGGLRSGGAIGRPTTLFSIMLIMRFKLSARVGSFATFRSTVSHGHSVQEWAVSLPKTIDWRSRTLLNSDLKSPVRILALIAAALVGGCSSTAGPDGAALPENCSAASPVPKKEILCTKDCRPNWLPQEIREIKRGAYIGYRGLFINDGYGEWTAVDFDHARLVQTRRYSGYRAMDAERPARQTPTHYVRETLNEKANIHWVEIIQIQPLDTQTVQRFACTAVPLWASMESFSRMVTDVSNQLILFDGADVKKLGGFGVLIGAASDYEDMLRAEAKKMASPAP